MTTAAEPLLPAARARWFDRWRERVATDPQLRRRLAVLAPIAVTLLAGILRFANLADPHAIIFDETYYVKDAWSQWLLGYPTNWPEGANDAFTAGTVDGFETSGSFIVHPPLGKWLIGAGMWVFGPETSFGWRFSVALAGTAAVLVLYLIAKTMTGSIVFATLAGYLMAIDGLAIVMSRVALLDMMLTLFILLAFWFTLLDAQRQRRRLAQWARVRDEDAAAPSRGPLSWRPWLIAAGAAAGAATAVKWSGLYVLAGLVLYVVVADAVTRRRLGMTRWPLDAVRQAIATVALTVPVAVALYLLSWTGWLLSDGGYGRHTAEEAPATGLWSWVPLPLQSLWKYHLDIYNFHVGLSTPHSYQSPAWQWPLLIRPTSMYWHQDQSGDAGCTMAGSCVQAISSIPNPLIWWAGVAAGLYLIYRLAVRRDWRDALVLTGIASTYVPWLLYPQRTIFQFYTIAIVPFLILALVTALRDIAGGPDASDDRRLAGRRVAVVLLITATVLSAFWYPVWTAMSVPYDFWRLHNWMPTWI